jgi:hypothetical protein
MYPNYLCTLFYDENTITGWLEQQAFTFQISGYGKFKGKAQAGSLSDEDTFLGLQMAIFSLHPQKYREGALVNSF